jgi:hypothetical protein
MTILLMRIGGYYIGDCWLLFYHWLLVDVLLMIIDNCFINVY